MIDGGGGSISENGIVMHYAMSPMTTLSMVKSAAFNFSKHAEEKETPAKWTWWEF